jgi:cytoskeletal protein RodZ
MKSITAFAAAAALIASVSIAGAQSGVPSSQTKAPEAQQKNTSQSTKAENNMMKSGASKSMTSNKKVTGNSRFCIENGRGGTLKCTFASMEACRKAAKGNDYQCSTNPSKGTTGAK